MKEKPVLFVGDWENAEKSTGRKLSIASRTLRGENPDGKIDILVPRAEDLRLYRTKEIVLVEFERRYFEVIEALGLKKLAPGKLVWSPFSFFDQDKIQPVLPGDYVFCEQDLAVGECHRPWAARILDQAGWEVVHGARR